jgi:hypothetical protein
MQYRRTGSSGLDLPVLSLDGAIDDPDRVKLDVVGAEVLE